MRTKFTINDLLDELAADIAVILAGEIDEATANSLNRHRQLQLAALCSGLVVDN